MAQRLEGVDWLVRAAWNRRVEHEEQYLWQTVLGTPVRGETDLLVPASANTRKPARTARLALHEGALAGTAAPGRGETAIDRSVRHSRAGDRRGRWERRERTARMAAVEFGAHAHLRTSAGAPGMVRAPLDDRIVAPRAQKRLPR